MCPVLPGNIQVADDYRLDLLDLFFSLHLLFTPDVTRT